MDKEDCRNIQMLIKLIQFDMKLRVKKKTINYHIDLLHKYMDYVERKTNKLCKLIVYE